MKKHTAELSPKNLKDASRMLSDFIVNQKGKIVSVEFISANGELKKINGRLGVKKHTKGTGQKPNANILTVYKMQSASVDGGGAQHYRSIRCDSIRTLKASKLILNLQAK